MPIYQYKCTDCNIETDVVRGIRETAPDPICYSCNKHLKRMYSSVGVAFNGSGWASKDK